MIERMIALASRLGPKSYWNFGSHHEFRYSARVWRRATDAERAAMPKRNQALNFVVTGIGDTLEQAIDHLEEKLCSPAYAAALWKG